MKRTIFIALFATISLGTFAQYNSGTSTTNQTDIFGNTVTTHRDAYGHTTGTSTTSRADIFGNTTTTHRDEYGRTIGTSTTGKRDVFGNTTTTHRDSYGNTTGTSTSGRQDVLATLLPYIAIPMVIRLAHLRLEVVTYLAIRPLLIGIVTAKRREHQLPESVTFSVIPQLLKVRIMVHQYGLGDYRFKLM